MNKKVLIIILIIVILIIGIVLITQQIKQPLGKGKVTKPNMTTEDFVSELQNLKSSMDEVGKSLTK